MCPKELVNIIREKQTFKGFTIAGVRVTDDSIIIRLDRESKRGVCPECGRKVRAEEMIYRKVRTTEIVKKIYNEFDQARIRCKCGFRGMEKLDFVDKHGRHTKRFEEQVALLAKRRNLGEVAEAFELDLKTVKTIADKYSSPLCKKTEAEKEKG